jgi:hypothetical protein
MKKRLIILLWAALPGLSVPAADPKALPSVVDFNRDIRPIFSETCFKCHGPDQNKRKGKLRLDTRDGEFSEHDGKAPFVPGNPAKSEAWRRINAAGTDDLMPPADSGMKLTERQVKLIGQWIREGAQYKDHWSFIPPAAPALAKVKRAAWPKNGIDYFILARLEEEKLRPSPPADKTTLIRRVTLDLTGLPPTPAEVDAFLADKSSNAYEKVVDRLLASPHYGERMALEWLDAARFADTHGYHIDSGRDMTRWRKWVIDSFNRNLPFDRFTIEQLAGDLLPNATLEQKIASGFNRNHMINFEGGAIPEEYHTAYLVDRVNATTTVWLGLTVGCAQCHDHKYDAITQKDYYRFYAFFNNVPENGLDGAHGNAAPLLQLPTEEQDYFQSKLKADLTSNESDLKKLEDELPAAQAKWEEEALSAPTNEPAGLLLRFTLDETLNGQDAQGSEVTGSYQNTNTPTWTPGKVGKGLKLDGSSFISAGSPVNFERTNAFSYGAWIKQSGKGTGALLAKMDEAAELRGFDLFVGDGKLFIHLVHSWPDNALRVATKDALPKDTWTHVFATYDGSGKAAGVKLYVNGREARVEVKDDKLGDTILNEATFNLGRRSASHPFKGSIDDVRVYDRALAADEVAAIADAPTLALVSIAPEEREDDEQEELKRYFREHQFPAWGKADDAVKTARKALEDFEKTIPTTMVMAEMEKPRDTFVLLRGQYDKPGEKVTAGVPASLPPLPAGAPANRLGLAEWLVSPRQPLTARVMVNRYWQMYFGTGIVKTAEDFGSQGEWPSHPELLDWLATEFMRSGWDIKKMQKLIVMSATYRQSSVVPSELEAKDPENRLLARGPRFRLPAEFIRDQALAISGLLNDEIGGASVSPYQPPGLWEELASREDGKNWTAQTYTQSHGPDLYRRTMYTFWKRTSPPPTLATFDAPDRETCLVRRQRTNTPLQALVLMNDPTYMEASRKLAERMMTGAKSGQDRITFAFRLAMARAPKAAEIKTLLKLHDEQVAAWRANGEAALRVLSAGESARDESLDPAELAAWTMVASAILNLDETVTKG